MNYRNILSNYIYAFASQGTSFLASFLTSLVVPKILGVEEFGYWQLFIFYTTYVGFFHFGLDDGVYLLNGGRSRGEINKRSINSQFIICCVIQITIFIIFSIIILSISVEENRRIVFFSTAFFMVLNNLSLFFGYVFQAMNETKLYSISIMIDRFLFTIPLFVFLLFRVNHFEFYIGAYAVSKSCSLFFCLWNARDFLQSGFDGIRKSFLESLKSISVGINLMLANTADSLILGVSRFLIDSNWGIAVFGKVSFSLSLVSFFITFVSQASMVLFPALRQASRAELIRLYCAIRDIMELFFPAVYCLYFPLVALISIWLPQYSSSLIYFAFLLPVCVFDSKMNICSATYLKVIRQERVLLLINLIAVATSICFSFVGALFFHSVEITLIGVVAAIIGRSLISELWLNRELEVDASGMSYIEIFLSILFITISNSIDLINGFVLYFILYLLYLFINRNKVISFVSKRNLVRDK